MPAHGSIYFGAIMKTGFNNMGCWLYAVNMGTWQKPLDPSRRFLGTISIEPKYAGEAANEPKYAGDDALVPKYAGTAAVNN